MSLVAAGLWISALWLIVYTAKYFPRRSKPVLPFFQHRRPTTEVTVKHLNIRLKTEAFNVYHDGLSSWLSSTNKPRPLRQILLRLYDAGSFLGAVGMLLGFMLLFLTIMSLSSEILRAGPESHYNVSTVTKRGLEDVHADGTIPSTVPASASLQISPIIPGLTVPLSHLPLILVALAVGQIVHEAGHGIAAALHRIPMLSCGFTIMFLFPSAFVTLPAARLEKLPPRDRLQIVSGGCFHNLVFWCLLFALARSGLGSLPSWILFRDISPLGRVVVGVDYDSPLAAHLPVGTIIVKMDDSPMTPTLSKDSWDRYLHSPSLDESMEGWCTNNTILDKALSSDCTGGGLYSCFVSKRDEMIQYALDPIDIFTDNLARCSSSTECSPLSSCVVPRHDQQLVRISVLRNDVSRNVEDMIVWKGPKQEIWEQVEVGNLCPRFPLVSYKFPKLASTFFEYMKMTNISLYLLNMLPIMALDGYQLLTVLLEFFGLTSDGPQNSDLEAIDGATRLRRVGRVQRVCRTFLSSLALLLVALCGLLDLVLWAKQ